MNAPEQKLDQLDACGRRGGGGCSSANGQDEPLVPPYLGTGGLIVVSYPSRKAFFVLGPETRQ